MRVRLGLFTLMVVGALALTSCGAGPGGRAAAPTTSGAGTAGAGPASAGAASYDFAVATLDGATFEGRSLAGKPAVLWFWAPWCPTCLGQARHVTTLAATYSGKATVVGVAGLDSVPAMHEFVDLAKLSGFPQLADEQGVVWKRFGMTAQSTFVVLDPAGAIVERGHLEVEKLPGMLDRLLAD